MQHTLCNICYGRMIPIPPKAKLTKEEIIATALSITQREGISALTARSLGAALGTSSRPIFNDFKNMEEVRQETIKAARDVYHGYVLGKGPDHLAFTRIDYIRFAKEEPKLFELLFMTANNEENTFADILPAVFSNTDCLVSSVQVAYGLSWKSANRICQSMWFFIHGLACLCVTGMAIYKESEVITLVSETFESILMKLKSLEGSRYE